MVLGWFREERRPRKRTNTQAGRTVTGTVRRTIIPLVLRRVNLLHICVSNFDELSFFSTPPHFRERERLLVGQVHCPSSVEHFRTVVGFGVRRYRRRKSLRRLPKTAAGLSAWSFRSDVRSEEVHLFVRSTVAWTPGRVGWQGKQTVRYYSNHKNSSSVSQVSARLLYGLRIRTIYQL